MVGSESPVYGMLRSWTDKKVGLALFSIGKVPFQTQADPDAASYCVLFEPYVFVAVNKLFA